jgi:hypothetical protein
MPLPKTLRIVGKTYAVIQLPLVEECGLCEDMKQEIKISTKLAHDLERDTLLHEAIHAIDYCMQLRMSEKQVNGMGTAIYALLMDNPELIKYLTAKPKKGNENGQNPSLDKERGQKPKRRAKR